MGQSRLVAAIALLAFVVTTSNAKAAEINERMSLVEAIEAVREEGIDVSYSSLLVEPWMRVRFTPEQTDPIEALATVLEEYGLALDATDSAGWLVVRGERPRAEQTFALRGRVIDAETGLPVNNAQIRVAHVQVWSDAAGRFDIPGLATQDIELNISAGGYISKSFRAESADGSGVGDFQLIPAVVPSLEEITIVASRYSVFSSDGSTAHFLSGEDIRLMPHIADDSFRVIHKLPGVAANDFQAPFNLRGGANDEVKVVIDGLELFEPYHMRSIRSPLSIIDPGIIGQAQVLSGGFTAEFGNHMSGVVDIVSLWPDSDPVHQLGVSFVSSFARSSGAILDDRGTYQLSFRRGYLDLITDSIVDEGEELSPRYSDLFASFDYRLNDAVDLAARVLSAADDVEFVDSDDGEDFGGESDLNYLWITADYEPRDGLRWTNTLSAGRVETREDGDLVNFPAEVVQRSFQRDTSVAGIESNLVWQAGDRVVWKLGFRYRDLAADYDYQIDSLRQTDLTNDGQPYTLVRDIVTSRDGGELGAHAALRYKSSDKFVWELGLRWDRQDYTDAGDDTQVSPRVNAIYSVGERSEIRLGWGHFYQPQGIHELQVQDGVTSFYPAQQAEHRVIGFRHRTESGFELQADIYQKLYSDVRPRFENALDTYEFAAESNFDRVMVEPESAESRGVELTIRNRQSDALDWWLNYTWSEAEDVISGVTVPRSWDQTHAVTGNLTWRWRKWSLSVVGRYHSGWPRTPLLLLPVFDGGGGFLGAESDLTQRNREEYDDYSRVDLRLSRRVDLENSIFEYYFEIYNVLNTENQCCVSDHDLEFGPSVVAAPNVDEFLPFFPSFGFVWTFGPGSRTN